MSDEEFEDQLAALRAIMDQAVSTAPESARLARALFASYLGEGFTDSQALYLTAAQSVQSPGTAP